MEKGIYKNANLMDYLQLVHPILMKGYLWTCLFMLDIVGLPTTLVGSPSIFIKAMIIPIIIINIWILVIRFDVERWQKLYILFTGIYCSIMSILLIMTAYRFYMLNSNANELLFLSVTIGVYVLILLFGFRFHFKALRNGYYSDEYQKKFTKYGAFMAVTPGLGFLIGQLFWPSVKEQDIVVLIISILFLFIAYIIELGIHNLHKYYLICKYNDSIKTYTLPRKKGKKK